jgi:hypothetical protein
MPNDKGTGLGATIAFLDEMANALDKIVEDAEESHWSTVNPRLTEQANTCRRHAARLRKLRECSGMTGPAGPASEWSHGYPG